jgi:hypothetical protein
MKTASIKLTAKYNRSWVMTRAHKIYKNNRDMFPTFSLALKRAWELVEANKSYDAKKGKEATWTANYAKAQANKTSVSTSMNHMAKTLTNYYANNTYNGD